MSIISQETWDSLIPDEEKEKVRQDYQNIIEAKRKISCTNDEISGAKYQMELLFGKENLQPLTYDDVAKELFGGKKFMTVECHFTSYKQAEKLLAINKLLNVCAWADMRDGIDIEISAELLEKINGIISDEELKLILSNDY